MMKRKAGQILALALALAMLLCGCGQKSAEPKEFKNSDGTFSVTAPGDFVQEDSDSADYMKLNAPDEADLGVMIQRMSKTGDSSIAGLEDFVSMYHDRINTMLQQSEDGLQPETITVEGVLAVQAESFSVANGMGDEGKGYLVFYETEDYYYVYSVTGIGEEYDKRIEEPKTAAATLKEL